jgi:hypothetical protein
VYVFEPPPGRRASRLRQAALLEILPLALVAVSSAALSVLAPGALAWSLASLFGGVASVLDIDTAPATETAVSPALGVLALAAYLGPGLGRVMLGDWDAVKLHSALRISFAVAGASVLAVGLIWATELCADGCSGPSRVMAFLPVPVACLLLAGPGLVTVLSARKLFQAARDVETSIGAIRLRP